jgi:hypothetical protein
VKPRLDPVTVLVLRGGEHARTMLTGTQRTFNLLSTTAVQKLRFVKVAIRSGWEIAHSGAVSRRPPISLYTMAPPVPAYRGLHDGVWDLSIVQGPFSVAPCQTLSVTIRTFASLCTATQSATDEELSREKGSHLPRGHLAPQHAPAL